MPIFPRLHRPTPVDFCSTQSMERMRRWSHRYCVKDVNGTVILILLVIHLPILLHIVHVLIKGGALSPIPLEPLRRLLLGIYELIFQGLNSCLKPPTLLVTVTGALDLARVLCDDAVDAVLLGGNGKDCCF